MVNSLFMLTLTELSQDDESWHTQVASLSQTLLQDAVYLLLLLLLLLCCYFPIHECYSAMTRIIGYCIASALF